MNTWTEQFNAYPQWVVLGALALTAIAVLFIFAGILKWIFKFVLVLAMIAAVAGAVVWFSKR